MRVYYDRDADVNLIKSQATSPSSAMASQGHAHALNLKRKRREVSWRSALRAKLGAGIAKAEAAGLKVMDPAECGQMGRTW